MLATTLLTLALTSTATAHFRLLTPTWRADSFTAPASQWQYPCANINATTDSANRTAWPLNGGSVVFNGSHPWAYTFVNLALGSTGANFNISLVEGFNQTGPGVFCFKQAGGHHLDAGLKAAGFSGVDDKRLDGMDASIQVIQLGERGSALYNCADIKFSSQAQLLGDDQCKNATGVSGVAIANVQGNSTSPSPSGSAAPAASSGAASHIGPVMGSGLVAAVVAWGVL